MNTIENGIHIWLLDMDAFSEKQLQAIYATLPIIRKEKADKIKAENHKKQSILAGYLLEKMKQELSHSYKISMQELEIACLPQGKPYFIKHPEYGFSLSHTDHFVGLCIAKDIPMLGLDLEKCKEAKMSVAKRFFTKNEYQYLEEKKPGEERDQAFFKLWTRKEAVIKALGDGLRMPLDSFAVLDDETNVKDKKMRLYTALWEKEKIVYSLSYVKKEESHVASKEVKEKQIVIKHIEA